MMLNSKSIVNSHLGLIILVLFLAPQFYCGNNESTIKKQKVNNIYRTAYEAYKDSIILLELKFGGVRQ